MRPDPMVNGRFERAMAGGRHRRRVLAILGVTAVSIAGLGCANNDGDKGADFTNRPGQNAPAAPGEAASSTTTTTGGGGMGAPGDDTSGQVGK